MTAVALNTAPAQAAPTKAADKPQGKDADKFGQLVEDAGACVAAAVEAASVADTPAPATPKATDATLEAILQSLRASLIPCGAAALTGKGKAKTEEDGKAKSEGAAKDGEGGEAATPSPIPAFTLAQFLPTTAVAPKTEAAAAPVDDVLSKAATPKPALPTIDPAALAALAKAPDMPAFDLSSIKAPDAPSQVTAQLDRLVDTARDAAWLDRLSQDIAASAGSGDKLKFRMMPPNLGALDVSVERQAAGMSVTMTTHTADARNLIADSRQQMVDSLKAQGVPLIQFSLASAGQDETAGHRPPTFFSPMIEAVPGSGTELAAQSVETTAERTGRFA